MKRIWLAVIVTLTTASAGAKTVGTIEGVATAKDGDDVVVQGIDIRLQGIAAPEDNSAARQTGGPEATASLGRIVNGKHVVCVPDGTKARGRPVATCSVGGQDVGELLVRAGHARDCPRFSKGRYAAAELAARATRDLSAIYPLPSYCNQR